VFSAVVFGSFAPDFEYFLRLGPRGRFGHTWPGLFLFDVPFGFIMLWLFHRYAKEPLWAWLPEGIRQRVRLGPRTLPLKDASQLALVLVSILVGAVTHILWDSFTHRTYWPGRHWPFLSYTVQLPVVGSVPYYEIFQHASTVIGLAVLLIWFKRRMDAATPLPLQSVRHLRANERTIFAAACVIALVAGTIRALIGLRGPIGRHTIALFIAQAGITTVSMFWLELVFYGILRDRTSTRTQTG
jgi:hypothetical protein